VFIAFIVAFTAVGRLHCYHAPNRELGYAEHVSRMVMVMDFYSVVFIMFR